MVWSAGGCLPWADESEYSSAANDHELGNVIYISCKNTYKIGNLSFDSFFCVYWLFKALSFTSSYTLINYW